REGRPRELRRARLRRRRDLGRRHEGRDGRLGPRRRPHGLADGVGAPARAAIDAFPQKKQTPTTPSLPLLYALDVQLDHIPAEGIENRWARHEAMRLAIRSEERRVGFRVLAEA